MVEYLPWAIATGFFALTTVAACVWGVSLKVDVAVLSEARDGLAKDLQEERRAQAWDIIMVDGSNYNSGAGVAAQKEGWGDDLLRGRPECGG